MKPRVACNYAVIRFMPYTESGEFVNVGVVLNCPRTGFFGFRLEKKRFRRISNFFPELQTDVFKVAIRSFAGELTRLRDHIGIYGENSTQQAAIPEIAATFFRELIRPRESLIRCGPVSTALSGDPEQLLSDLFGRYVERLFARSKDYQEEVMKQRLAATLKSWELLRFYKDTQVGNEEYKVRFPFVHEYPNGFPERAIRPLNLNQPTSTQIYDHGEQWVNRVKRLQRMDLAPENILFAVAKPPQEDKRYAAFEEVCRELAGLNVVVTTAENTNEIREFATVKEA